MDRHYRQWIDCCTFRAYRCTGKLHPQSQMECQYRDSSWWIQDLLRHNIRCLWYAKIVGKVTTYTLTSLSNDTPYFIAISSVNSVGFESAKSPEITITPIYDITKPTESTLTAIPDYHRIVLNWTSASDTGTGLSIIAPYKLVKAEGTTAPANCASTALYQGTALTFTDTGLTAGQPYSYRLCAYDNAGNSSLGTTVTATPTDIISHWFSNHRRTA